GLVLRSVPFLRQFGGSLVAIAVGFYLFYPVIFGLLGMLLPPIYYGQDASDLTAQLSAQHPGEPGFPTSNADGLMKNEQSITGDNIFSYFNSYPSVLMEDGCLPNPPDGLCAPNLGEYFSLTALNFVRSVLLPSVGLILTVMFVKDLSGLFGEEVDAGRLVQLV
ncbi:MAG: hypothetical protein KGH63_04745, partial [Candidatus Micrarchaeota archaeon]|nr:hypothetical protein [Candidatus Micrarchaeota archaeon]